MSTFDSIFQEWVLAFSERYHYPVEQPELFETVDKSLPEGIRETIVLRLRDGTISSNGYQFALCAIPGKAYSWLGKRDDKRIQAHWEYFVQVAEYGRLYALASKQGFTLKWEDDKMDVSLYNPSGTLFAYFEAKKDSRILDQLISGLKRWEETEVDPEAPHSKDDSFEKAKYLVKRRPEYFSAAAIGKRYEFRVHYPEEKRFSLREDVIPI